MTSLNEDTGHTHTYTLSRSYILSLYLSLSLSLLLYICDHDGAVNGCTCFTGSLQRARHGPGDNFAEGVGIGRFLVVDHQHRTRFDDSRPNEDS